jgi:hypothetical protein
MVGAVAEAINGRRRVQPETPSPAGDWTWPSVGATPDYAERCQGSLDRFAIACTVCGDLFNHPVCGFVQFGRVGSSSRYAIKAGRDKKIKGLYRFSHKLLGF